MIANLARAAVCAVVTSQLVGCIVLGLAAAYVAYEKWISDTYTVTIEVDQPPDALFATMSRVIKQRNPDAEILKDDPEEREFEARGTLPSGHKVESSWSVSARDEGGSELEIKSKVDELSKEEVQVLTHQSLEEILSSRRIRWVAAE